MTPAQPILMANLNNTIHPTDLTSKDKKYIAAIEKSLANFSASVEWADYISFLTRLQKLLGGRLRSHWIPHSIQVLQCLARCLLSALPSGVHRKALEVYESVYSALGTPLFAQQLHLWLPGVLPVMLYAAILVKPQLIAFLDKVLDLPPNYLRGVTKVLVLAFLPGIDDEQSELFDLAWALLVKLRKQVANESHFWQLLFAAIVAAPERRLGALVWCSKEMPAPSLDSTSFLGLALTAALSDDNILVQRGFFDVMVANVKLSEADNRLIMAACRTVLRKDMLLNRRLWSWLLGADTAADAATDAALRMRARSTHFRTHGMTGVNTGILRLIASQDIREVIDGYRICLALMDRWEIGLAVSEQVFLPFLHSVSRVCKLASDLEKEDVLSAARAFFDTVESMRIWRTCFGLVNEALKESLELVHFVVTTFNVSEDDMVAEHLPLIVYALLKKKIGGASGPILEIVERLLDLFASFELQNESFEEFQEYHLMEEFEDLFYSRLQDFYQEPTDPLQDAKLPLLDAKLPNIESIEKTQSFTASEMGHALYVILSHILCMAVETHDPEVYKLSCLFSALLQKLPKLDLIGSRLAEVMTIRGHQEAHQKDFNFSSQSSALNREQLVSFYGAMSKSYELVIAPSPDSLNNLQPDFKEFSLALATLYLPLLLKTPSLFALRLLKTTVLLLFETLTLSTVEHDILELLLRELCSKYSSEVAAHAAAYVAQAEDMSHAEAVIQVLWAYDDDVAWPAILTLLGGLKDTREKHVAAWLALVLTSEKASRFVDMLLHAVPPLDDGLDLKTDLQRITHHLELFLMVLEQERSAFLEALGDNKSRIFELVQRILVRHVHGLQEGAAHEHFEGDTERNACVRALQIAEHILDGLEAEADDMLALILSLSQKTAQKSVGRGYEQRVLVAYFEVIRHYISICHHRGRHLQALEEGDYVQYLIGLLKCINQPLEYKYWVRLLVDNLVSLSDCIFQVVDPLTSAICGEVDLLFDTLCGADYVVGRKVEILFDGTEDIQAEEDHQNNEMILLAQVVGRTSIYPSQALQAVPTLLHALDELLAYAHVFLLASEAKPRPTLKNPADPGFLTLVMLGVFLVEAPNEDQSEANRATVHAAVTTATTTCYSLWRWADSQPREAPAAKAIRPRARALLERLYRASPEHVLQTAVLQGLQDNLFKMLHVLDGGRPQMTLPHVLELARAAPYPRLLAEYVRLLDAAALEDVYADSIAFMRDVAAQPASCKTLVADVLEFSGVVCARVGRTKFGAQKRIQKEAGDVLMRVLACAVAQPLDEPLCSAIAAVAPELRSLGAERASAALSAAVTCFLPALRDITHAPGYVVNAFGALSCASNTKAWRLLVHELFCDAGFFEAPHHDVWKRVLRTWAMEDKDRISELVSKNQPYNGNPGALFNWNEGESRSKVLKLRRITYILMACEKDAHLSLLNEIMARYSEILESSKKELHCEVFLGLRAVVMRFTEPHLTPHWPLICSQLERVLREFIVEGMRAEEEMTELNYDPALLLAACKLLDLLLTVGFEEFLLDLWLFVDDSFETIDKGGGALVFGLADKILRLSVYKPGKSIEHSTGKYKRPVLWGIKKLESVCDLKGFFDSLGYWNFERFYQLKQVDWRACEEDVEADLCD